MMGHGLKVCQHSQRTLTWRISKSMDALFCVHYLEEALHRLSQSLLQATPVARGSAPTPTGGKMAIITMLADRSE